jgi:hypothetical protein
MGCKKEEDGEKKKPKPGRFECEKCGQVRTKKKKLCKPQKITKPK